MQRGQVSEADRKLGIQLCRDWVGGVWSEISDDEFQMKPISGGLVSYLFVCSISIKIDVPNTQPRSVLLRVYGNLVNTTESIFRQTIVFAVLAERRLGPKLSGLNTYARIEEFLPAKNLTAAQLSIPKFSRLIARRLAQFHKQDMPLDKEPTMMLDIIQKWLGMAMEILRETPAPHEEHLINKFRSYNLEQEFEQIKIIVGNAGSEVVFCHNDLHKANIMYDENCNNEDEALTIIDYDFSSYNYRGADIGRHFSEWGYDYSVTVEPYFSCQADYYPTPEQKRVFFKAYLSEMGLEFTDEEFEKLSLEADKLSLLGHLFAAFWAIMNKNTSDLKFGFLRVFFEAYLSEMGLEGTDEVFEKLSLEADKFSLLGHLYAVFWAIMHKNTSDLKFGFLIVFFEAYLSKIRLEVTDEVLESLSLEADTFTLLSHLCVAVVGIMSKESPGIKLGYLEFADSRMDAYFAMKKQLGL